MASRALRAVVAVSTLLAAFTPASAQEAVVNVYTFRQPDLIKPALDAFTTETGIRTEVLFVDKGLEDRIAAEGENSPADVIVTVDIARLSAAKAKGVTQALEDETVNSNIPASYRDPENHWFGLTKRARVFYASNARVPEKVMSYAALSDPRWKGRLCSRSGQHEHNLALFSAAILHWGEQRTEEWLRGIKANLSAAPSGMERDQVKAIAEGRCDLAIGNADQVGFMQTNARSPEQQEWAKAIHIVFPLFENGATHVNIAGAALARYAPHRDNAVKLIQFLSSPRGQQIMAEQNFEYPVEPRLKASTVVQSFGPLTADALLMDEIENTRQLASEIVGRIGYDNGPER